MRSKGLLSKIPILIGIFAFLSLVLAQLSVLPAMWETSQSLESTQKERSYKLAFKESFGFFDDVTETEWLRRQHVARTRIDHLDENSLKETDPKLWYLNNYYPSFSCPEVLRVGRSPGDGPKYVCDPHRIPRVVKNRLASTTTTRNRTDGCIVYSVGSAGKFEFEDGLIDLIGPLCSIHIFDPKDFSVPGMKEKNMYFHSWGIASSSNSSKSHGPEGKFLNFQDTIKELGHENRTIDILKIGESTIDSTYLIFLYIYLVFSKYCDVYLHHLLPSHYLVTLSINTLHSRL